ncbi:hypothetical protein V2J09_021983 [Rumex salicifolius]
MAASETCILNLEIAVMNKSSKKFTRRATMNNKSQDKDKFTLRINESEEAAFMDMISFIYDTSLNGTSRAELVKVLMAADKFEVTSCMRHCIQLLSNLPMTIESAVHYLELHSMVFVAEEVEPLIDEVKKYFASHFKDFTK